MKEAFNNFFGKGGEIELWYIVAIPLLVVGLIVYIAQLIKENKEKESFYNLLNIIEKVEREKIQEELNEKLDEILKEIEKSKKTTKKK